MKNVRIGILTFHSSYNFGANLQALAVQSAFEKHGADVVVINFRQASKDDMYRGVVPETQIAEHERFLSSYLKLSPLLRSSAELERFCTDELDCVVVGSDAVFRLVPKYEPRRLIKLLLGKEQNSAFSEMSDDLPAYFLQWNGKSQGRPMKASIAASSMGTQYYYAGPTLYLKLFRAINDFDFISVRDEWTFKKVRRAGLGRKPVEICPDPVFSLKGNFKIPYSEQSPYNVSETILLSGHFPDYWRKALVKKIHAEGKTVSNLPNPETSFQFPEADFDISLPLSPLAWFELLGRAAGFIGVRFHALVSSAANCTPALSVDTPRKYTFGIKRRNKIFDLWNRIGAPHRFYTLNQISRTSVDHVFDVLFNKDDLERESRYADHAKMRFDGVVRHILKLADRDT